MATEQMRGSVEVVNADGSVNDAATKNMEYQMDLDTAPPPDADKDLYDSLKSMGLSEADCRLLSGYNGI